MKKFYVLALLATLSMPVIAHAEDAPTPPTAVAGKDGPKGEKFREKMKERMEEHLKKVDTNGDGAISKDEFLKEAEGKFAKMDTNGDGKITKEEREAAHDKWKSEHPRGPKGDKGEGKGEPGKGGPKDGPAEPGKAD